jgi:hypothetical protein
MNPHLLRVNNQDISMLFLVSNIRKYTAASSISIVIFFRLEEGPYLHIAILWL